MQGIDDVAAAYFGRAYALQDDARTLHAWLDVLRASGQWRALHAALVRTGHADNSSQTRARITGSRRSFEDVGADRSLLTHSPVDAAWVALSEGRHADAELMLRGVQDPYNLTRLAELYARRGEVSIARRTYARARIAADERGATMRLAIATPWRAERVVWVGERLAVYSWRHELDTRAIRQGEIELWDARELSSPVLRYPLRGAVQALATTPDSRRLIRRAHGQTTIHDALSGVERSRFTSTSPAFRELIATANSWVLLANQSGAELWTINGEIVETFEIEEKRPTRAQLELTSPVSLALSDDAMKIAIGGSDSIVRLIDRARDVTVDLAYDWGFTGHSYNEVPQTNHPIAIRFVPGTTLLRVLYQDGGLIDWDTTSGKILRRARACKQSKTTRRAQRLPRGRPAQAAPATSGLDGCVALERAQLSADASWFVAITRPPHSLQVRDARTGERRRPDQPISVDNHRGFIDLSPAGQIAFEPGQRGPAIVHERDGVTRQISPRRTFTALKGVRLSDDGRVLSFYVYHDPKFPEIADEDFILDLTTGRPLAASSGRYGRPLAVSPDGELAAYLNGFHVELRGTAARERKLRFAVDSQGATARFSSDGSRLIVNYSERGHARRLGERRLYIRDLIKNAERVIEWSSPSLPAMSASGALLATAGADVVEIWDASAGVVRERLCAPGLTGEREARQVALTPDGAHAVWIVRTPGATVAHSRLTISLAPVDLESELGECHVENTRSFTANGVGELVGAPLVISPDGREVLVWTGTKSMVRWRPFANKIRRIERSELEFTEHVRYSRDGAVLFFQRADRIVVRRRDNRLTRIGTVFPLASGSWITMSESGAVDGGANAASAALTVLEGPVDRWIESGELAWDRMRVPGLYKVLLTGYDVKPPISAPALRWSEDDARAP